MARPLRLQLADALYHVTSRGNGRQAIFKTVADHQTFLDKIWSPFGLAALVEDLPETAF